MHVNVPPEKLYELVSDVRRMGEWSPETTRCRWLDGASGPVVGARFKGTNRRGPMRWSTKPTVTVATQGKEFAFVVPLLLLGRPITEWRYRFEPAADGGTDVTESFELVNDVPWWITFGERWLMGVKDRKPDLERGMQETLARLKAVAEGSA